MYPSRGGRHNNSWPYRARDKQYTPPASHKHPNNRFNRNKNKGNNNYKYSPNQQYNKPARNNTQYESISTTSHPNEASNPPRSSTPFYRHRDVDMDLEDCLSNQSVVQQHDYTRGQSSQPDQEQYSDNQLKSQPNMNPKKTTIIQVNHNNDQTRQHTNTDREKPVTTITSTYHNQTVSNQVNSLNEAQPAEISSLLTRTPGLLHQLIQTFQNNPNNIPITVETNAPMNTDNRDMKPKPSEATSTVAASTSESTVADSPQSSKKPRVLKKSGNRSPTARANPGSVQGSSSVVTNETTSLMWKLVSNDAILEVLNCQSCQKWMGADGSDVLSCDCSSICKKCFNHCYSCPSCKSAFKTDSKVSQLYRRVAAAIHHPCKYDGCPHLIKPQENHEENCEYKPFVCYKCCENVPHIAVFNHFTMMHPNEIILTETILDVKWADFHDGSTEYRNICCISKGQIFYISLAKSDTNEPKNFLITPCHITENSNISVKFEFSFSCYSLPIVNAVNAVFKEFVVPPEEAMKDWQECKCKLNITVVIRQKRKLGGSMRKISVKKSDSPSKPRL